MTRLMYMVRACWRAIPLDVRAVLITLVILWVSIAIAVWWFDVPQALLGEKDQSRFVTGEAEDCPPFYQCTPTASWNAANCKCWDAR